MYDNPRVGGNTDNVDDRSTIDRLIDSMLDLVHREGPSAATVRAIAAGAGVTEAVLYRYFPGKDPMYREVWDRRLESMIDAKRALLERPDLAPAAVMRAWVHTTFEQFDADPAAFNFVFLCNSTGAWRRDTALFSMQSELFQAWITEAVPADTLEPLSPSDAARCIAGMLLAVPRGIVQGTLAGPAVAHAEGVTAGCSRLLGLH